MTPGVSPFEEPRDNQDEKDTQPSSTSWRAYDDSEGHWTACFAECPDWAQISITKQVKKQLWSYGSFPGIKFANKLHLEWESNHHRGFPGSNCGFADSRTRILHSGPRGHGRFVARKASEIIRARSTHQEALYLVG